MSGSIMREKPSLLGTARQSSVPNENSPLKLFTYAKSTITKIFKEISSYVDDTNKFLDAVVKSDIELISVDKRQEIQQLKEKVKGISSIISRDHMKVVFFGRTSNGKSTTMNAMLRERILPSGMGHTTNCFLQIEGTDKAEPFVLTPESDEPKNVSSLGSIGSALSREKLDSNSLVKILWPKEKCRLIRDDVVLVDSPGIDVSANLDHWIKDHCLDADVFVMVISAEATISGSEKNFLHNVAQHLSNPNIFILLNRWDATADEPETADSVRQQHIERGSEFLCDELHLCDRQEAANHRMFFISAREALLTRVNGPTSSPRGDFKHGYKERLEEFKKFEEEFEKCISKTAIQTKFQQHTNRAKAVVTLLSETNANIANTSQSYKENCTKKLQELEDRHVHIENDLHSMTESAKEKIRHISEDVYKRVAQVLNDEIKRLYSLIEDFDRPFSPDPEQIPLYKRDLHRWLEERLGSNLQSRLHSALYASLDDVHREIKTRVKNALENEDRKSQVDKIVPRSDFTVSYRLDLSNLCADFCEDIGFKFSLGLTSIWQKFVQNQKSSFITSQNRNEISTSTSFLNSTNDLLNTANNISILTSKSGLLMLGVGALLWRGVGWKVVGVVAGVYGSFYLYERLMWTKKAQERAFKRQYADYASSKMKLIVDLTSGNASGQVKQELSMYFAQTLRFVDMEKDELTDHINQEKMRIQNLASYAEQGKKLKRQADQIDASLNQFTTQYLTSEPNVGSLH